MNSFFIITITSTLNGERGRTATVTGKTKWPAGPLAFDQALKKATKAWNDNYHPIIGNDGFAVDFYYLEKSQ